MINNLPRVRGIFKFDLYLPVQWGLLNGANNTLKWLQSCDYPHP